MNQPGSVVTPAGGRTANPLSNLLTEMAYGIPVIPLVPFPEEEHLDVYYRHARIAMLGLERNRLCPVPGQEKL